MNPVELPSKVILDAMFEKFGLLSTTYSARPFRRGHLEVTVAFYPIVSDLERPVAQTFISTSPFEDLDTAQNHVAAKAIKFMEQQHNVVPGDYNYAKLVSTKHANETQLQQLKEKDSTIESIKKANVSFVQ